jgi:hypothetical protein
MLEYSDRARGLGAYDVAFTRLPFSKMSPLLPFFQTPYLYADEDRNCDCRYTNTNTNEPQSLAELELPFTRDKLVSYTEHRKEGRAKKSLQWLEKA